MPAVLIDTGPLAALLRANDSKHAKCAEVAKQITGRLLTTWPVITEAAYLLRYDVRHVNALLRLISEDEVEIAEIPAAAANWFADFFTRFANHEPQLADASLIYIAEREDIN